MNDTRTHSPHCAFILFKSAERKKILQEAVVVDEEDERSLKEEGRRRGSLVSLLFLFSFDVISETLFID
jgi:hypothetical protein